MNTKAQAEITAIKLREKLKGPGWKTRVRENLGWFASATKTLPGGFTLHVYGDYCTSGLLYRCLFGQGGAGMGNWYMQGGRFADPNKAVEFEIKNAMAVMSPLMQAVNEAQAFLLEAKKPKTKKKAK